VRKLTKHSIPYPFPLNATSTTLTFSDGLSAIASTTIGNGTQSGGLTISGGAPTTANFLVQGTLAAQGAATIGTTLAVNGTTGTTTIASGQGFTVGGSQFVVQQGSGNVGIGTTSPVSKLAISDSSAWTGNYSTLTIVDTGTLGAGLTLQSTSSGGRQWSVYSSGSGATIGAGKFAIYDGTVGSNRLVIDQSGYTYLNETSEGAPGRLNLAFNSNIEQGITILNTNNSAFNGYDIRFQNSSDSNIGSVSESNTGVAYNTTSDRRLKENIATTTAGLATLMQVPVDNFDFINDPTHTQVQGFIAQSLYPIYPEAVTTNGDNGIVPLGPTSTPWEVDYGRLTPLIVSAVQDIANISSTFEQNLIAWLGSASNGIGEFFAQVGNFQTTNTETSNASTTNTQTLNASTVCLTQSNGQQVCVTGDQLAALLSGQAAADTPISVTSTADSNSSPGSSESATSTVPNPSPGDATDTPAVIQVNGDNPAIIQAGATYNDLGATITGPQADLDLGITTYVNVAPMSPVQIDTSSAATDTIDYVATDQNGLTSTTTRTVIIQAPSIVPTTDGSTTDATTTAATSTSS
jgi:hypothetical protein